MNDNGQTPCKILKYIHAEAFYLLQGPDDDQEPETKETVTELQLAMAKKRALEKLKSKNEKGEDGNDNKGKSESDGINWGMGEIIIIRDIIITQAHNSC